MLPGPAATLVNLDPGAESYFTLEDLDVLLFAHAVLAASAVVGRHLYRNQLVLKSINFDGFAYQCGIEA